VISFSGASLRGRLAALALASGLASGGAQAEVIKCFYTEPFQTTTYSSNANTLTTATATNPAHPTVLKVSLQILKPNLFELWNARNQPVQRMTLNFKGSDGMSDFVFPYDGLLIANKQHGGCVSNHLHRQ
jgi:hypothetical protein